MRWYMKDKCSAVDEMGHCLATTDTGRKLELCPFLDGGAGTPSNTIWPGTRPTSVPSGILMHVAVWPQQTSAENWGLCYHEVQDILLEVFETISSVCKRRTSSFYTKIFTHIYFRLNSTRRRPPRWLVVYKSEKL